MGVLGGLGGVGPWEFRVALHTLFSSRAWTGGEMETSPINKSMSLETERICTSLERETSHGSINKHLLGEQHVSGLMCRLLWVRRS